MDAQLGAPAPMPQGGGAPGAGAGPQGPGLDAERAKIQQMVQGMLQQVSKSQPGGLGPASSRYADSETQQRQFRMQPAHGHQEDIGNALYNAGVLVNNLAAQHKQRQVKEALADWQGFDMALKQAQLAAGDPQAQGYKEKVQENLKNMPWVTSMLDPSNPKSVKRLKNMYKALNQDLFDGKENVYGQALKQFHKTKQAESQMKQNQEKLDQYKQQTIQKRQEMLAARGQQIPPDPRLQAEGMRAAADIAKGSDTWHFTTGKNKDGDPVVFAIDSKNPTKAMKVKVDGEEIKSPTHSYGTQNDGKVATVEGVPSSIVTPKGFITPKDPEFWKNPRYVENWQQANEAWAKAEGAKQKLAGIRAQTYELSRQYAVYDSVANTMVMANPIEMNKNPGRYAPGTPALQVLQRDSIFKDMEYNADNVEQAIDRMKTPWNAQQRAMFIAAMRSDDLDSAFHQFLGSTVAANLKDDQMQYLYSVKSLMENAIALKQVAGLGAGSDTLRQAILATVPGSGTPNAKTAKYQLKLFKGTRDRLHSALPNIGQKQMTGQPDAGADEGWEPAGKQGPQ